MSVAFAQPPVFSPMHYEDLERISAIERVLYEFPWTAGNFRDSLNAGYSGWVCRMDHQIVGYAILMIAIEESHLLNISVTESWQGRGLGGSLLNFLVNLAQERHCTRMLLEVRQSNRLALQLYQKNNFYQIGMRKDYYPASIGREDAIVLERLL